MFWIGPGRRTPDKARAFTLYAVVSSAAVGSLVGGSIFTVGSVTLAGMANVAGIIALMGACAAYTVWRRGGTIPLRPPQQIGSGYGMTPPQSPMYPGAAGFPQPQYPGQPGYSAPPQYIPQGVFIPPPGGYAPAPLAAGTPGYATPIQTIPDSGNIIDVTSQVVDVRPAEN